MLAGPTRHKGSFVIFYSYGSIFISSQIPASDNVDLKKAQL